MNTSKAHTPVNITVYDGIATFEHGKEIDATVELLEAAPDLLAALQSCLDWMEYTIPQLKATCPHCHERVDVGGLNWGGPVNKARAAIAKALAPSGDLSQPA